MNCSFLTFLSDYDKMKNHYKAHYEPSSNDFSANSLFYICELNIFEL